MPLRKRARFTTPTGRFEVGESSLAAAARQAGHTLAHIVDYEFIDTMDASIRAAEIRAMTVVGVVNERVTDLATTQRQETHELKVRCEDAQDDRALLGAQELADEDSGLKRWNLFIRNCTVVCQIKFATYTLQGNALMWWNSHVKTVGHDASYAMTWKTLKKMMNDNYNQRFQELALMCSRMFPEESNEVEKYVVGLPDMIQGSVMASKPKKMQDAIKFTTELMDQKIRTLAERQAENKRKFEDTSRNNQNQQHPFKRHNVTRAYNAGPREKSYGGSKPLCPKCNYHHDG
ncbi:hypothetical protein Tco_0431927 [Tanacetum coccineum]